jgi:hypothetical protein
MMKKTPERIHVIVPHPEWADWFEDHVLKRYVPKEIRDRIFVMRPEQPEKEPSTLDEILAEMLKDPVFRKEWEESEAAYQREFGIRRVHHDM